MKYKFVGWNKGSGHDKVWGAVHLGHDTGRGAEVLIFWGRRGHKLQYKFGKDGHSLLDLIYEKRGKGYQEVYKEELSTVYPEFEADIEKCVIIAKLKR
jgi:predicted DNA-binding WGR domain protein